ncbi:MAG: hypothetical protein C0417_05935 [Chlorobiaceae bacterium]|nr:hypothetical protein [Chlorobiaceae bacterium]
MKRLLLITFLITAPCYTQVTLQTWTEVYGTVNGQRLGQFVLGIKPTSNLPYRAAVSKNGSTSFFRLQTPTDTSAQLILQGENPLVGDLNNDGYQDVVGRTTVSVWDTVLLYWGTPTGIDTLNPLVIHSENQYDELMPACIGDINNDGKSDLILSAVGYPGGFTKGKVYIYINPVISNVPDTVILGDSTGYGLGTNCVIGDLNQDGFNDLAVRGYKVDNFNYVNIYYGSEVGRVNLELHNKLQSPYATAGSGLACFDVNGDEIADLLWTNGNSGNWVYVHYGSNNFSTLPSLKLKNPGVANFGSVIINAGDMNGDGYDDVAVGAYDANITSGFVFIFGGGQKIDSTFDAAVGMSSESFFGYSISSVGDINGDGLADIVVGAPNYAFANEKGYWGIFLGDTAIHVTDVKDESPLPQVFYLYQSYPNPFNPKSTIKYQLNESAFINLEVFNMLGQKISLLVDKFQLPGEYEAVFNGSQLSTSVYLYKLTAKTNKGNIYTDTKKLTLIK